MPAALGRVWYLLTPGGWPRLRARMQARGADDVATAPADAGRSGEEEAAEEQQAAQQRRAAPKQRPRRSAGDPGVCQVVECGVGLQGAPPYNRRYRICGEHYRAPCTVVDGVPSRFCQARSQRAAQGPPAALGCCPALQHATRSRCPTGRPRRGAAALASLRQAHGASPTAHACAPPGAVSAHGSTPAAPSAHVSAKGMLHRHTSGREARQRRRARRALAIP